MPTKHPRHAITETPRVHEALNPLREALGGDRVDMGELVILGAQAKLKALKAQQVSQSQQARAELAAMVRAGEINADPDLAREVRQTGWAR